MERKRITRLEHRLKCYHMLGIFMVGLLLMAGCAGYSPKPLPQEFSLSPSVVSTGPAGAPEGLEEKMLTLDQVASLAVRDNPDLKAKQEQLGVAGARLYSAGLLPDPQISAGLDFPMGMRSNDALQGGDDRCLLIDETAFLKKGTKSVGVSRQ